MHLSTIVSNLSNSHQEMCVYWDNWKLNCDITMDFHCDSLHVYHNMFMLLFSITLVRKVNKWLDPMFVFIGGLRGQMSPLPIVYVDTKWFNHSWIVWFWKWVHDEKSFLGWFRMNHHMTTIRQGHYIWFFFRLTRMGLSHLMCQRLKEQTGSERPGFVETCWVGYGFRWNRQWHWCQRVLSFWVYASRIFLWSHAMVLSVGTHVRKLPKSFSDIGSGVLNYYFAPFVRKYYDNFGVGGWGLQLLNAHLCWGYGCGKDG